MRGLDEIRKINENPDAYHASRGQPGVISDHERARRRDQQRFHGERVDARQAQRNGEDAARTATIQKAEVVKKLDELLFTAILLDILASAGPDEPEPQERIDPIDNNEPPFFKFWAKLNAGLIASGKSEAGYRQAREAFSGGTTPVGALTFIGKQWDGLRAVPAKPVTELGGVRPAYHGEYRIVSDEGTCWHKVVNDDEGPIVYKIPEAAITAAEYVRNKNFAKEHH